jgi:hypothetical protein
MCHPICTRDPFILIFKGQSCFYFSVHSYASPQSKIQYNLTTMKTTIWTIISVKTSKHGQILWLLWHHITFLLILICHSHISFYQPCPSILLGTVDVQWRGFGFMAVGVLDEGAFAVQHSTDNGKLMLHHSMWWGISAVFFLRQIPHVLLYPSKYEVLLFENNLITCLSVFMSTVDYEPYNLFAV